MTQTSLVLLEDDQDYIASVRALIVSSGRYRIDHIYHCVVDAAEAHVDRDQIWLVDLGLGVGGNGTALIPMLVERDARVLVTSICEDEDQVIDAITGGASGYHVKGQGDLLAAIAAVESGAAPLSPRIATHLLRKLQAPGSSPTAKSLTDATGDTKLSPRELQTLQALAHGYTYREVADRHNVSYHTVGDHVKAIYRKFRVNSRTAAINHGLKHGLLSLDEV